MIITGFCKCVFLAYLSDGIQETAGRAHGSWVPSPVPGSVSLLFINSIVFSISSILDFRVSASANAGALASLYFLRVALNY